ncbi:MAG: hypothetical protein QGH76_04225 [Phycisphaerales bacterium]|jgi:hypothetical protein|nr:hypothetical protein [Phycisphaerales bacterium]
MYRFIGEQTAVATMIRLTALIRSLSRGQILPPHWSDNVIADDSARTRHVSMQRVATGAIVGACGAIRSM